MKVRDAMSTDVALVNPDETIQEAARAMISRDIGALPVGSNDRLVGMVTDRDIAVRAVARGLRPDTKVREVMSSDIRYCFDDQDVNDIAANMGAIRVRRLPVVNRDKRLVGIVSICDVAACEDDKKAGQAMAGISTPGGAHSQAAAVH